MSAKTKDKMLKILEGGNAQDGKEQKKHMVYLEWNFIDIFIEASIYWISAICSEDVCITPEHSPLWPSDFILHLISDGHWFRKWLFTCSVPDHYLNQHCLTPSRPLGPTEETLATRIKRTYN